MHWSATAHKKPDGAREWKTDGRAKGGLRKLAARDKPTWLCPHPDCNEQYGLIGSQPQETMSDCAIWRHYRVVHGIQCPHEVRLLKLNRFKKTTSCCEIRYTIMLTEDDSTYYSSRGKKWRLGPIDTSLLQHAAAYVRMALTTGTRLHMGLYKVQAMGTHHGRNTEHKPKLAMWRAESPQVGRNASSVAEHRCSPGQRSETPH